MTLCWPPWPAMGVIAPVESGSPVPSLKEIKIMNSHPVFRSELARIASGLFATFALLLLLAVPAQAVTPLGATIVGSSVQFALYSQNATRVEVWIFATATASTPTATYALTQTDMVNHIWTVTVSGLGAGTLYGYRVWGSNWTYNASW